ncbi:MAG: substrate-binding domain-containing protein [Verrucomicrobia bacterium]|nr:substrate-binding domain-containing protein [Verrucomicrobiota bacterium]
MARPRSPKVQEAKERMIARLREGFHRPGQRFLSNRAVAEAFGVSYQTAHRLMGELQAEGWLARAPGSGSFVPGPAPRMRGVALVLHERARRRGSFGAQLRDVVREALEEAGVEWTEPVPGTVAVGTEWLPVLWEQPEALAAVARERRFAILVNDRPPPGLAATVVDGLAVDDYSGGAAAAEILRARGARLRLAVLAGPAGDPRSEARVQGFCAHAPKCDVIPAGTWYAEEAGPVARRLARREYEAVFCCNDRLAAAVVAAADELGCRRPALVGFDDAPVAEELDLTTIAIPWERLAGELVELARRRLAGDLMSASQRIFSPHPVMRRSHLAVGDV